MHGGMQSRPIQITNHIQIHPPFLPFHRRPGPFTTFLYTVVCLVSGGAETQQEQVSYTWHQESGFESVLFELNDRSIPDDGHHLEASAHCPRHHSQPLNLFNA